LHYVGYGISELYNFPPNDVIRICLLHPSLSRHELLDGSSFADPAVRTVAFLVAAKLANDCAKSVDANEFIALVKSL